MSGTLTSILLVTCFVTAQAQGNDAEKLYRTFENRLKQAKALRLTFETRNPDGSLGLQVPGSGDLTVAKGNRFQLLSGITSISDGKKMAQATVIQGKTEVFMKDPPENSTGRWKEFLSRTGLAVSGPELFLVRLYPLKTFDPTDFKLGEKQMIRGQEAQIVEYSVPIERRKKDKVSCKLWIVVKTGLPAKRTVEYRSSDGELVHVIELYTNWQIDPVVDDSEFALEQCANRHDEWLRKRGQK